VPATVANWLLRNTLVDHGADINWIGWDDKTPLDLVDKSAQPELSEWLRTQGAKGAKELRAE
jgi:hypothetical protein